jgi:hypothetical protein
MIEEVDNFSAQLRPVPYGSPIIAAAAKRQKAVPGGQDHGIPAPRPLTSRAGPPACPVLMPGHAPAGAPAPSRTQSRPGRAEGKTALRAKRPHRLGGDRGAGTAEVVIAVPLLMLLILLIVQFAIWEHASAVAQATAEEALAVARVQGGSAAAGQQRAAQVLGQAGSAVLVGPQVSITRTAASATVQITATAEQVLPFPGIRLPIKITVAGPVERFVPATGGG